MGPDATEELRELRDTLRRFFADTSPSARVRRLMATDEGYDPRVWAQMAGRLGLQGLAVPERFGGAGYGMRELAVVMEEMGRALVCAPFLSTVVLAARASGDRVGRAFPVVAMVLFPFGVATSLGSVPYATYEDTPLWVNATDPAWPLTQVALFCASVAVIRARRWQGAARWLPLAGSLWLVPCMIAQMFLSEKGLGVVYNGWMLGTYVALGALFLARPETARPLPRTADA